MDMFFAPRLRLAALLLGIGVTISQADPESTAGPMVGHVTQDSAKLWMLYPAGTAAELSYWEDSQAVEKFKRAFTAFGNPVAPASGTASALELKGLKANTRYRYEVSVGGDGDPAWNGSFTTAPMPGVPAAFRIAVTSCMKTGQPTTSWFLMLAQNPALHLTLGDTHYADTPDPAVQMEHHLLYRRGPEFATVLRELPTYAIWDDHDFGPNDSDGTVIGKEHSLRGWSQFWANPGAGTKEIPGAFFKFTWGEVEFFVVDGRYHRSPDKAPDDEAKRMLGDAQFGWLLEGLKQSTAKFKVIASGSTLDHSKGDGWRVYTFSRHRLFDSIREHGISGVVYMSGDVHRSEVWVHPESERVGYPLVEVISSGIANSKDLSFATVDFDTKRADPSMRVRIVHGDGTVRKEQSWKLSQLGGNAGP